MKRIALAASLSVLPCGLHAQFDFTVGGRPVQIHSFLQQGFTFSNANNYLTMNSSQGSAAMTDGGANIGMSVTDQLHIGAQVYFRNIGQLGKWHPELDWAYGDYRFKDWLGVRAGKVKTALGLYNDTQDTEFLHTWALLPQSVYPLDLRSNTIAHVGADVYGEIPLYKLGKVSYTGYAGRRTFDPRAGYYYFSQDQGIPISTISGRTAGGDLRWNTPLQGLFFGVSFMDETQDRKGVYASTPWSVFPAFLNGIPYELVSNPQRIIAHYFDFARGRCHFNGELRKSNYLADVIVPGSPPPPFVWDGSEKGWFLSAAFRVNKRFELGTYHSRYYMGHPVNPGDPGTDHIYDQTVTARLDITRFWNLKVEGATSWTGTGTCTRLMGSMRATTKMA